MKSAKFWGLLTPEDGVMWAGVNRDAIPAEYGFAENEAGEFVSDAGYAYASGQIENILASDVTKYSFYFLGGVFVLLLFMIHGAGKRWHRGRPLYSG